MSSAEINLVIVQNVRLEDRWQDFLRFDLDADGVIRNANAQGWLWNGRGVANAPLDVGDHVEFRGGGWLKYPVVAAETIAEEDAS